MFWRKTREAIGRFHPLHQRLIWERGLSVTLSAADWEAVLGSMSQHAAVVRRRKWALPGRVPAALVPLIRVLLEDIGPYGTLGITADLRGSNVQGKVTQSRSLRLPPPVRSCVEWYEIDPWLRIRAELRDGSVLDLSVIDRHRKRKITKRSSSGKIKTKTKTKTVQIVRASRVLAKGATVHRPAGPPPSWIRVKVRSERRTVIRAGAKISPAPAHQAQTDLLLTVATELFRWTPPGTARLIRKKAG